MRNNCFGQFNYSNGDRYVGTYFRDRPNGQGTHIYFNRQKYIGEFKDGKFHGSGTLYAADGSVIKSGTWVNDRFVQQFSTPPQSSSPEKTPAPQAKSSTGSAFRKANGQLVTNHHVAEGCSTIRINGKLGASVFANDPINDLAILSLPDDRGEIASIRTTRPLLNESITTAGFPLDGTFSGIAVTNGTINRLSGLKGDTGQLQISAPVQPGNSGGPLLDIAGNIIGVVSGKLNEIKWAGATGNIPQNVNFAIGGNTLRAFLDAKGINYKEVGREGDLRGEQIATRASAFTVLVECK